MGGLGRKFEQIKNTGQYFEVTKDRDRNAIGGNYKNFKAGEPNRTYTEEELRRMKKGKTLLGAGSDRKEGL